MYNKNKVTDKINEFANILYKKTYYNEVSLFSGNSGIVLFLIYYSKKYQNQKYYERALELLSKIIENINNGFSYHTFAGGLAGIGWLIEFLEQNDFLDTNTDEILEDLDSFLFEYMKLEFNKENYDYLHGAAGIALYFLKRKKSEEKERYLSEFINLLDKMSIKERNRIKWIFDTNIDENTKEKVYNLSMSHGIASLISVLSKIFKRNINTNKTKTLIEGAVNYLLYQEQDTNQYYSFFPSSVKTENHISHMSRLAWCYGDLGISVTFWNASETLKNQEWKNKALEIMLYSSNRKDLTLNRVNDAGLCHGTAGIAHIFNRMHINTGIPEFRVAAEYWYDQTLKMTKFENDATDYKVFKPKKYEGWQNDNSFLEGIAGIGLALMSAISDIDPAWDEILLLS